MDCALKAVKDVCLPCHRHVEGLVILIPANLACAHDSDLLVLRNEPDSVVNAEDNHRQIS